MNLAESVENLYKQFQKYDLPEKIHGCPHCELDDAETKLHSVSLAQLSWDDFGVYPFKAMTTFGDELDFKHFLPRILELFTFDYFNSHYSFDIFLEKLKYANWKSWENYERDSILIVIKSWMGTLDPNDKESDYEKSIYEEIDEILHEYRIELVR